MKVSRKNNYPLVQIHCIIKIMCQDLPLGCLNCLFGVCCAKIEIFSVVFKFLYFTGTCKKFEIFTQYFYAKKLFCPNFSEFLHVPVKYENSNTTAKVSVFAQHTPNKQFKHPKGKFWHIIFIIQWICKRG
jgi:hypothetical protein